MPRLVSMQGMFGAESDRVHVELEVPPEAVETLGSPRRVKIEYMFSKREPSIGITLHWFSKQANRLPEAIWFSVVPKVDNCNLWKMDKMGQLISPLEVVRDGNRNLHAVASGLYYEGAEGCASIQTLDAPLVAPGEQRILRFDNTFPSLDRGLHFLLYK